MERRALCRLLAVLAAASFAEIVGLSEEQWVIWSAASVALADPTGAWDKNKVRAHGVLIGVPFGLAIGWRLPASGVTSSVLALLIGLSLVGIPNYGLAITTRAALVTAAGLVASHGAEIGLERVRNLLIGGLIGYLATAALNAWWRWRQGRDSLSTLSPAAPPNRPGLLIPGREIAKPRARMCSVL